MFPCVATHESVFSALASAVFCVSLVILKAVTLLSGKSKVPVSIRHG